MKSYVAMLIRWIHCEYSGLKSSNLGQILFDILTFQHHQEARSAMLPPISITFDAISIHFPHLEPPYQISGSGEQLEFFFMDAIVCGPA